ncbi:DEAD/DEAH box helicase [Agathobaculum butyriciproducens]|uniref:DEAD/DEAH box helicase n=2 Tax=Agathobaculum TaxID=2048137 RepID=UPI003AF01A2F
MKFNELKLEKNILKALKEAGYSEPTPIQQQAIPPVLEGRDLMGCAQTGTGKTCAFAVPIIQRLAKSEGRKGTIRALILTPTRELALQIYENVCQYARYVPCSAAVIFGGVSQVPQVEAIERGVDILIATPGRLWDLMGQKIVKLDKAEFFVLDEADRMLDMGFFPDVKRIVKFLPKKRQTLLFSATIPAEIADLAEKMLHEPEHISVTPSAKPADKIEQQLYFVEKQEKRELLPDIIRQSNVHQVLVFTRTKHGADRVARDLNRAGIKTKSIHGDKSQNQRQRALADFKECKIAVLVATDIAARGIDINDLPLVINFDLPNIPETYVHRIGRTGRAGQEGTAISFCDRSERPYLKDIEKLIGKRIPVAGEIPHEEKEEEKRESGQRRTTNKRSRRKPVSENATAEEVAADVAREKEAKKKARQARANAKRPSRREKAAEQQTEQQAKAAAPRSRKGRNDRNDSSRRGRRSDPYARFEKNEPRVDAHTPSRAYALSDEAAARIRRKVEAALAARAAKADGKAAPQQEKKGRGHGSRSAHKPAPQQNKTAQSKTTNHRGRSADGTRARNGYHSRRPNNNRKG